MRGLAGTDDLIVAPNTQFFRPGSVTYEGPVYVLNYEKPVAAGLPRPPTKRVQTTQAACFTASQL